VDDFLKPFMVRFIERMREVNERTFIFIEGIPHGDHPRWTKEDPSGVVNAFHWYDGPTLFTKFFRPWFSFRTDTERVVLGRKRVAALFREQLARGKAWAREEMGNMPCLLGEFGLPFDMNGKRAFKTGNYGLHEEALSLYYDALDANLLHGTIWNYTANNTHQGGDGWNGEDLSIYSEGQGRAEGGWLRPYPMATAGTPLLIRWDRKKGRFQYRYRADSGIKAPTEVFIPPEFGAADIEVHTGTPEGDGRIQTTYKREAGRVLALNDGYDGEVELIVFLT
jgi:hypothetical protein